MEDVTAAATLVFQATLDWPNMSMTSLDAVFIGQTLSMASLRHVLHWPVDERMLTFPGFRSLSPSVSQSPNNSPIAIYEVSGEKIVENGA